MHATQKHGPGDWRVVDRALREHARKRAELDADELRWIREAMKLKIWKRLGMVSMPDYLERVFGYAPHVGRERVRVAQAVRLLPAIHTALAAGELCYSAVRELSRIATPQTDAAWCTFALGKTVRDVERHVAARNVGDSPTDPGRDEPRTHVVRLELGPEAYARFRAAQTELAKQRGGRLDDDALVTVLAEAVLDRTAGSQIEPTGRAKFQIAVKICPHCEGATQEGGGAEIAIDHAAVERAHCDAQHLGSLDAALPERAHQDVPPAVVRHVWRRAGGRCQVSGCRSTIALEVHHVIHRAHGGDHDPSNLRLLCSSCHAAIHAGTLVLDAAMQAQRPGASHVEREARAALVELGFKPAIARAAVDAAASRVGRAVAVEVLVQAALRECPRPVVSWCVSRRA